MEKLKAQSWPRATTSSTISNNSEIAARAKLLLGCYRTGDANDPQIYVSAVTAVLAEYSMETIMHVTDPRTGIAGRVKWLPTVAEIKEACENHASQIWRRQEREEQIRKQIAERETLAIPDYRPKPSAKTISYAEFINQGGVRPIGRFEDDSNLPPLPQKRESAA